MSEVKRRVAGVEGVQGATNGTSRAPSKVRQATVSRKVWASALGLVVTMTLWGVGEIDAARAVEAMTWVLGVFIGAVAVEDGMTRFMGTLQRAPQEEDGREE